MAETAASKQVKQLQADMAAGKQVGQDILGPEGLGRIREKGQIQDVERRLLEQAEGYSGAETTARREAALQRIQQSGQAQSRALQAALARSGVKGGAAAGAQLGLAAQGVQQRAASERELFMAGEDARRAGTSRLAEFQVGSTQFDIAQAAKEKDVLAQTSLSAAQLASSERSAERAAQAAEKGAQIQAGAMGGGGGINLKRAGMAVMTGGLSELCFLIGTEIKMEDGSSKKIEDLKEGDMTLFGGKVTLANRKVTTEPVYMYRNTFCTENHEVYENGSYISVKDSPISELVNENKNGVEIVALDTEYGMYVASDFISVNSVKQPKITDSNIVYDISDKINAYLRGGLPVCKLEDLKNQIKTSLKNGVEIGNFPYGTGVSVHRTARLS